MKDDFSTDTHLRRPLLRLAYAGQMTLLPRTLLHVAPPEPASFEANHGGGFGVLLSTPSAAESMSMAPRHIQSSAAYTSDVKKSNGAERFE